ARRVAARSAPLARSLRSLADAVIIIIIIIRGASPLGLPHSVARSPRRRSLRSAGSLAALTPCCRHHHHPHPRGIAPRTPPPRRSLAASPLAPLRWLVRGAHSLIPQVGPICSVARSLMPARRTDLRGLRSRGERWRRSGPSSLNRQSRFCGPPIVLPTNVR